MSQINHLFIIDCSAASTKTYSEIRSQVNDTLDSIKENQSQYEQLDQRISMFLFDSSGLRCLTYDVHINDQGLFVIHPSHSNSRGPILDAIGTCIGTWRAMIQKHRLPGTYHVTIFSSLSDDGSRKYSICTLKTIITSLQKSNWQFTLVSDHRMLGSLAKEIGIPNYYICKKKSHKKDRQFLIRQLKRQWILQNAYTENNSNIEYAA